MRASRSFRSAALSRRIVFSLTLALLGGVTALALHDASSSNILGHRSPHAAAAGGESWAAVLQGKVVRVIDGDTVSLQVSWRQRVTVRLASIDAPELGRDGLPGQPFAQKARQALQSMVEGRNVTAHCYEVDHYERYICDLKRESGEIVNRELVRAGLAWANREKRDMFLRDHTLLELEEAARKARSGLWVDNRSIAPWQWRFQCWRQGECGP